ncbi:MAG: MFS transporter [Paracoccaceae bacterium]|jgi:MFS family permease|nr:MFS transporter [Paracoccaceae bacterium]
MTTALHDTPYAWGRLALSLATACVANVGMWAPIVVMPAMEAEFGTDRGTVSLAYTVTMAGFALGTLLIGRWVDRVGIAPCLAAASCLIGAGYALAAFSPSIWPVIAVHAAIGFGAAVGFGPLVADVSHWFLRRRGIAMAIAASGNYLSGAIWPLLLAGVQAEHGWRGAYLALAVIVPALVLPLSLTLRRRVTEESWRAADAAAALRARTTGLSPKTLTVLLFVAGIACCVAMSMPQVHIVAYCVDLGYGPAVGAEMLSLMLLGGVVSRLVSGFLADRLGGLKTLLLGSALQTLALVLFLPSDALVSLYLVSAIFGLAQGGIVPAYAIIVREYLPAREAGARVGIVTFATIAGMALGGWMSGAIYDATGSYLYAFLNGIGWNVLNLAIVAALLALSRPRRQPLPA